MMAWLYRRLVPDVAVTRIGRVRWTWCDLDVAMRSHIAEHLRIALEAPNPLYSHAVHLAAHREHELLARRPFDRFEDRP